MCGTNLSLSRGWSCISASEGVGDEIMKVAIGCDHGGLNLKVSVKELLNALGHEVEDFGCHTPDSCDYPDIAVPVANAVVSGQADRGILICGTGIGIGIAANKIAGIRAALCHDTFSAHACREHNDANILVMPGRFISTEEADMILTEFFSTQFEGGRHQNRIDKIPVK